MFRRAAISRVPARDEPWITRDRLPWRRTGADLGLGRTLTSIDRGDYFSPVFGGYPNHPDGLAVLDGNCSDWTETTGLTPASANIVDLSRSGMLVETWGGCDMSYRLLCVEE